MPDEPETPKLPPQTPEQRASAMDSLKRGFGKARRRALAEAILAVPNVDLVVTYWTVLVDQDPQGKPVVIFSERPGGKDRVDTITREDLK